MAFLFVCHSFPFFYVFWVSGFLLFYLLMGVCRHLVNSKDMEVVMAAGGQVMVAEQGALIMEEDLPML